MTEYIAMEIIRDGGTSTNLQQGRDCRPFLDPVAVEIPGNSPNGRGLQAKSEVWRDSKRASIYSFRPTLEFRDLVKGALRICKFRSQALIPIDISY